MKKLNKVAVLFASAAIAAPIAVFAQSNGADNWRSTDGSVWKNGTNELCWRDAGWTPATAAEQCDGAIKPPPPPAPAPKVAPPPPPPPAPAPAPAAAPAAPVAKPAAPPAPPPPPPAPVSEKVTFAADAFFDSGKSALKPEATAKLGDLVDKTKGVNLEVKNNRVYTEGKGSSQPVADNKTAEGRAKNRRVEVEVVGTRTKK